MEAALSQDAWSHAHRCTNSYEINHYLVEHFGHVPLVQLGTFEIQVWHNKSAVMYSARAGAKIDHVTPR